MSKYFYPAVFTKEDSGYSVRFPSLDGCCTEGDSLEEPCFMAVEAIGLYLEDSIVGKTIAPKTNELNEIKTTENETVVLIEFDDIEYLKRHGGNCVNKTVSIPQWLSTMAEKNNLNLSQVLQTALERQLNIV